jgi:hypothetical protein
METYWPRFKESPTNIILFPRKVSSINVALKLHNMWQKCCHLHANNLNSNVINAMISIKTSINQVNNMVWQFVAIGMKLLHENFRKGVVFCFYCSMQ